MALPSCPQPYAFDARQSVQVIDSIYVIVTVGAWQLSSRLFSKHVIVRPAETLSFICAACPPRCFRSPVQRFYERNFARARTRRSPLVFQARLCESARDRRFLAISSILFIFIFYFSHRHFFIACVLTRCLVSSYFTTEGFLLC